MTAALSKDWMERGNLGNLNIICFLIIILLILLLEGW